jgi:hypothetical protein
MLFIEAGRHFILHGLLVFFVAMLPVAMVTVLASAADL